MSADRGASALEPATLIWTRRAWITFPRKASVRYPSARGVLGDGYFLGVFPGVGLFALIAAAAGGLAAGLFRLGYQDVYTESVVLLAVLIGVGALSGQLGLLAWLGFVLGDVISTRPVIDYATGWGAGALDAGPLAWPLIGNLLHIRVPRLITYLLLLAVMVILPRAARGAIAGLGRSRRMSPLVAWSLVSALLVVIMWLGVQAWTAAAPTLVRPVFTWGPRGAPTAAAMAPLQVQGSWIVATAVAVTLVRQVWIGATMAPGVLGARLRDLEDTPTPPVLARERAGLGPMTAALISSALATLTLAGILERWWMWPITFGAFFGVRWLRSDRVHLPWLERWRAVVNVAPAWARLIALWLVSRLIVQSTDNTTIGSYSAMAVVVVLSVVVVFAVFPGLPRSGEPDGEPAAMPSDPSPVPGR